MQSNITKLWSLAWFDLQPEHQKLYYLNIIECWISFVYANFHDFRFL